MQALAGMPEAVVRLSRGWTYADLDVLPDHDLDWRCFQIVDGTLVVSPMPGIRHEVVCTELRRLLDRGPESGLLVLSQLAVDMHPSYLAPDVLVVSRELLRSEANPVPPELVHLVVEVVSPSSQSMDRLTKPAQYAAAGIPAYWRVETRPEVTLTAYELPAGAQAYREVGTWGPGETARLNVPFPVEVPVDAITPPPA